MTKRKAREILSAKTLREHVTTSGIERAKSALADSDASGEMVVILAALEELSDTTNFHADDLLADGFVQRSESARQRADKYEAAHESLLEIWSTRKAFVGTLEELGR